MYDRERRGWVRKMLNSRKVNEKLSAKIIYKMWWQIKLLPRASYVDLIQLLNRAVSSVTESPMTCSCKLSFIRNQSLSPVAQPPLSTPQHTQLTATIEPYNCRYTECSFIDRKDQTHHNPYWLDDPVKFTSIDCRSHITGWLSGAPLSTADTFSLLFQWKTGRFRRHRVFA